MILDRFEGDYAICELNANTFMQIKKQCIAENAKEGDVLVKQGAMYIVNMEETMKRRARIRSKMDLLFQRRLNGEDQ